MDSQAHKGQPQPIQHTEDEVLLKTVGKKREWFNNVREEWREGKPLELGPPQGRIRTAYRRCAPERAVRSEWRVAGIRGAVQEPARQLNIPKSLKKKLNREHYFNGLMELTPYLKVPVLEASVDVHSWSDPSRVLIEAGTPLFTQARRNVERFRAKRRQREAIYELAGYISAHTSYYAHGGPSALASAVNSVVVSGQDFRKRLEIELPGAVYLAAFGDENGNTRAPDKEHWAEERKLTDFEKAAKAYDERLRKLGYRRWDPVRRKWEVVPEGKPLPKPLDTEIKRLAQNARDWIEYDTRGVRRNFGSKMVVDDHRTGERRPFLLDTRDDWARYVPRAAKKPDPWEDSEEAQEAARVELAESRYKPRSYHHVEEETSFERVTKGDKGGEEKSEHPSVEGLMYFQMGWSLERENCGAQEPAEEKELDTFDATWHTVRCEVGSRLVHCRIPQWKAIQNLRKFRAKEAGEEKEMAKYRLLVGLKPGETMSGAKTFPASERVVRLGYKNREEDGKRVPIIKPARMDLTEGKEVPILEMLDAELTGKGESAFGLSAQQREIFARFYGTGRETGEHGVEGQTLKDIAKDLGVTEGSVYKQLGRIKKKVAEKGIELPDMHRGKRRVV